MQEMFSAPLNAIIAAVLFALAAAMLLRAASIHARARRTADRPPMLLPIRAWRYLITGLAVLIAAIGFALGQPWVVLFALVLGIVEGLESSMMVSALEDEVWDTPRAAPPHPHHR